MKRTTTAGLLLLGVLLSAATSARLARDDGFDHWQHRKLFVSCETCHAGAAEKAQPLYPPPVTCANCHNGKLEVAGKPLREVSWQPPEPRVSNLRFTHSAHGEAWHGRAGRDSTLSCMECHGQAGAAWMAVEAAPVQAACMTCHQIRVAHYSAPDSTCATCHLTLAKAVSLPRERVARFPTPSSHQAPGFSLSSGHGAQARQGGGVAQSCATCHAREFCTQCHVNAPEVAAIQALESDPRSLAIGAELKSPADHQQASFQRKHGSLSRGSKATCANCHTQPSCVSCHRSNPSVALALPPAGAGRGSGAQIVRTRPATHTGDFADRHASLANSAPRSCNACHARSECLECHRPNPAGSDSYHPAGFLSRHPAAAYNRQSDCSQCHNQAAFCTSCHTQSGFGSSGGLLSGKFHDAQAVFVLGHGQAARQNLETCVTCHSERDCLACHSSQTRGFNPHGPGFDADRLRRKNPETCAACHGRNIPGR